VRRGLVLAGVLVAMTAGVATAYGATAVVTIDGQLTNKAKPKLDRKKFKPTSISVSTTTLDAANPDALPPKPTQAVITYDKKDVRFNSDAAPKCDPSQISGTTTEGAIDACGAAQVGTGLAVASLPFGTAGTRQDFPSNVTAFNRADEEGILLHARTDSLGTTTLLTATLRQGYILTVTVPPIAGGVGSSTEFNTTVEADDYIQARCKDKLIDYKATFTFSDAPEASATDEQACKQKPKKQNG
jgi:hypothetical protein